MNWNDLPTVVGSSPLIVMSVVCLAFVYRLLTNVQNRQDRLLDRAEEQLKEKDKRIKELEDIIRQRNK